MFHAVPSADERAAAELEADSELVLKKLFTLGQGLPGRPRISAAVTEGEAVAGILRHARMVHADVIALGMHARDGAKFAGRVDLTVLHVEDASPYAASVEVSGYPGLAERHYQGLHDLIDDAGGGDRNVRIHIATGDGCSGILEPATPKYRI